MAIVGEMEHIGETQGMENHDHDLVQDLNKTSAGQFDEFCCVRCGVVNGER